MVLPHLIIVHELSKQKQCEGTGRNSNWLKKARASYFALRWPPTYIVDCVVEGGTTCNILVEVTLLYIRTELV